MARGILARRSPDAARFSVTAPSSRGVATETHIATTPGAPMISEWDADTALRWAFYANTFVYASAKANGEDVSSLPIRAGRDPEKPTKWTKNALLAQLLGPAPGTPSPQVTSETLIAWTIMQYRVTGRFAWEIVRANGQVTGLYPLPVSRLRPIPSAGGDNYFTGFDYDTGRGTKRLSAEQVLYHWRPSATDWRQPESVLQAARLDISVAVMQDRYDYAFLKNDARPAAVIVHQAFESLDDRDAWRSQFVGDHQGPDNAGRIRFAEAGEGVNAAESLSIQTLGLSQRDAEFIARYNQKRDAILIAMGTPLSRLGNATGATFDNSFQEAKHYWKSTVWPLCKDIAGAVNMQLAPELGDEVMWFDKTGRPELEDDRRFSDADIPTMVNQGLITLNEGRAMLGLPPSTDPGADELRVPITIQRPVLPPAPEPLPVEAQNDDVIVDAEVVDETTVARLPGQVRGFDVAALVTLAQARSLTLGVADQESLERQWTRGFDKLLDRQQATVLSRLNGKRGRQATRDGIPSVDAVFDPEFWLRETTELASGLLELTLSLAGGKVSALLGLSFDVGSPMALAFIGARANQLAGQVTDTTYRNIQKVLSQGVEDGASIPSLATSIRGLFQQTYAKRAETVARTEVISAYNGGTREVADSYGRDVIAGYEWLATSDARTRPSHSGADGQVIEAGQSFVVGGRMMRYPGDPAGGASQCVNCRCTMVALTPEDMAERGFGAGDLESELTQAIALVAGG